MHNRPETLGCIIKAARESAGITIEALANKVDITERYLYRIENEGKKPSFDVLHEYSAPVEHPGRLKLNTLVAVG